MYVNRDYRLNKNSNFTLWYDHLKTELNSIKVLDVIDTSARIAGDFTLEEKLSKEELVRGIIIGRLSPKL